MTTGSEALSLLFRDLRTAASAETGVRAELTQARRWFEREPHRQSTEAAHPRAGHGASKVERLTDPGICPTGTVG